MFYGGLTVTGEDVIWKGVPSLAHDEETSVWDHTMKGQSHGQNLQRYFCHVQNILGANITMTAVLVWTNAWPGTTVCLKGHRFWSGEAINQAMVIPLQEVALPLIVACPLTELCGNGSKPLWQLCDKRWLIHWQIGSMDFLTLLCISAIKLYAYVFVVACMEWTYKR
jgi:hypothetical protein